MESWFPEREFFMRSRGQVRFIKISSGFQKRTAALALTASVAFVGSMGAMSVMQYRSSVERVALLEREADVATSEDRLDAYRADVSEATRDLEERQDFIESMVEMLPDDALPQDGSTAKGDDAASSDDTAELVEKVSTAVPEAAELARIEARQIAFVESLTRFADRRSEQAMWALRELGLDPARMLAAAETSARGGPLDSIELFRRGDVDPRFERLGVSLQRMATLETTLDGVPRFAPTNGRPSSSFGYRRDPFTGGGAMHSGMDFAGPTGSPIYATADGKVTFVGNRGGYGKVIEISHGQGLTTRYAHLSGFRAKVGDRVEAGDVIAAMGSTGRSTGSHLHFEVRVNGAAVNPRTFLELAPDVLEKARRNPGSQRAAASGDA